jgi:proprotein convertase subtilisin/kexin type 5
MRCPQSFYTLNGECVSCGIDKCAICNKNDQGTVCTSCIRGNLLWENKCITPPCPEGYGLIGQTCQKCQVQNCKTCKSLTTCTECIADNFLFGDKTCNSTCPISHFKNVLNNKCERCGSLCEQCSDSKICLKCLNLNVLLNNACFSRCPDGYVNISQTCEKCTTENCKLCSKTDPTICEVCKTGLFIHNNSCVKVCPEYTFNKNSICTSCPQFCVKCINENVCTRCESLRVLLPDGTCSSDVCPEGTVQINGSCINCNANSNCKRCDPKLLSKCTECYDKSLPVNGVCPKL